MTTHKEALTLALEALSKSDDFLFDWHENESDNEADAYAIARQLNEKAITAIKEALAQPEQEPKCNPHPKAPHGFNRNASHANDRYTCECESWDAYDAGYQAGVMAGIEASMGQEPEQEPVAITITGKLGNIYSFTGDYNLKKGDKVYTTPPQRKPLTDEQIDAIASSVRKVDTPESVLIRLSRAIEAAHGIKGEA